MKKRILGSLWGLGIILSAGSAQAGLLELRLGLGQNFVSPGDFNAAFTVIDPALKMEDLFNVSVDALVNVPVLPLGAGVRFEQLSGHEKGKAGSLDLEWDMDVTRYAAVVNFRLIDLVAFLGPIATMGTHKASFESGSTNVDLDPDGLSYSIGAEGGINLKGWILGAEAGYLSMKFKKDPNFNTELDLSGLYGKVLLGRSFL